MSSAWSWYVIAFTIVNILACGWLIRWTQKRDPNEVSENEALEHTWDEDLKELNNPMPYWWLMLFYLTIVFGIVYLILYPGLGNFKGALGWSQTGQYEQEVQTADDQYGPIFQQYADWDITKIAQDAKAVALGRNLFGNNCAACHGSDARGVPGFPNLADKDWLFGGDPNKIYESILNGRNGLMPAMGAALDDQAVNDIAAYVRSLSGLDTKMGQLDAGKTQYQALCMACHGSDGKGNQLLGAPNLSDEIWLHSSSPETISRFVREGLNGQMPAHKDLLGEDKVRVLSGFIYSLSNP